MAKTEPIPFSSVLRRYRTEAGLTQEALAERARLSARAVSDLERGVMANPRPFTLRQLGEALGLSPEEQRQFEEAAHSQAATASAESLVAIGNFLGARPKGTFVAREKETARFRSLLDEAAAGSGRFVLLEGEPGSGKTRLLQELMAEAERRGYTVAIGRSYAPGQTTDGYPFLEAFSGLSAAMTGATHIEAERRRRRIARLLTGHRENGSGTPTPAAEHQLASEVAELGLLCAKVAAVAILLDDLQWADRLSLSLLGSLARATRGSRILIAGAIRDVDVEQLYPDLAAALRTFSRERLVEQMAVRRLSMEETSELVAATMEQSEISEELAAFVYRRTKGNPGLVAGLVRSLGGRLELKQEIGAGSMGGVFKAYDHRTDSVVAAKIVLARAGVDLDAQLRFQQEASVLAALDHPNIVRIYDSFIEEHATCIIMELLDGRSLGTILQDGPPSLSQSKDAALQAIDAIAYAHSQSIVHRDIKPDNVMVLESGTVKVTDFGIARILEPDTSLGTIATTGMRMGTPLYMAPEQIEGGKVDGRTDVYALGALLYHMVVGRPPFEGDDALAIAVKHLKETPIAPSKANHDVPEDWDALILKALSKSPSARFRSADEMRDAVVSLSTEHKQHVRPRRHRWPLTGGAVAAVTALAVAALLLHMSPAPARASIGSQLQAYFSQAAKTRGLSGTVLVARHGKVLLDQGYGFADRAARIPNRANSTFGIGGVTPVLSSTQILSFASRGVPRLDDPICKFLPHCPASWKVITVRMVLDGTSNIPYPTNGWGNPGNSIRQTLAGCQSAPLDDARPGSRMDYNGYTDCDQVVMGLILQAVSQTPWNQSGVFNFPGMSGSGQLSDAMGPNAHALAYQAGVADPNITYDDFFAAYSTASDVYAFDNDLFGGKLLTPQAMKLVFTPRARLAWPDRYVSNTRWGYFWRIANLFGRRVIYTLDGLNDFQTVNMQFPRAGVTIIILSNDISIDLWDVAVRAAAVVFHVRLAQPRPLVNAPQKLLGTYRRTIRNSDRIQAHDPGLKSWVGQTFTLDVRKRVVSVNNSGGEYFQATRGGMLTFLGYIPTNSSSWCSNLPSETPPTGYYHWSLHKNTLILRRTRFDTCPDRATLMAGVWSRVP